MNKYGAQAMRHWKTHAPERYRLIEKPTRFFTELGLEAQGQISELARRIETNRLSGERFECPPPVLPEKLGFPSADIRIAQSEQAEHDRILAYLQLLAAMGELNARTLGLAVEQHDPQPHYEQTKARWSDWDWGR